MGELHLASSGAEELQKLCVIKTILSHLADEEFVARFLDEAKVVVKLSHANLIPVHEAGQVEGRYYLALEHIEGRDLRDIWNRLGAARRRFPLDVALFIVREVCRGLSYVHSFGELNLVHRDVSPPNVMLSYTGDVRLTDFGVATSTIKLQKTAPGILMGKLSYMSPEQALNQQVDARADVYALGIILWELLTGERLFSPEGDISERYKLVTEPNVPPPSRVNPDVPSCCDLVVLRALSRDPESRHQDAESLRKDLSGLLGELAPGIDGSAVEQLLREVYGDAIAEDRKARRELLERMAAHAGELDEAEPVAPAAGAALEEQERGAGSEPTVEVPELGACDMPYIRPGTQIEGRYVVEELIGEGGMGRVYLTTHAEIGKKVALKILHPTYSRMPDLVARFRREARSASRIGHPHIVEVYDSGTTDDGSIYFVMEYLSGIDLADVLASEGRLGIERAMNIATQVSEAVAAAHEAEIIHRDLKPENIFLTTREGSPDFVKVLDFGLALSTALEESRQERLTSPGIAMGTPEYMAPEQAAGKPTDHRADVYAVGTLLYEMLVGDPPHVGDNVLEVFNRKATEAIVAPIEIRPEVPLELNQLVMWTLEYLPEKRPQTMAQLSYELTKLARGRAGAVASLLGIPETSRNASGGIMALSEASLAEDGTFAEEGFTAELSAGQVSARRRSASFILGSIAAVSLAAAAVVGLLFTGPDRSEEEDQGPHPAAVEQPAGASGSPGAAPDQGAAAAPPGLDAARLAAAPDGAAGEPGAIEDAARSIEVGGAALPAQGRRPVRRAAPRSAVARGHRHLRAGRFDEARSAFRQALTVRELQARGLMGLAEVEFQRGRYAVARTYASQAVKSGGGWRAQLLLANVCYKLRDFRLAVRLYRAVLAVRPKHPEATRNLAAARRMLAQ